MSNPYAEHFAKLKLAPSLRTAAEWAELEPAARAGLMFSARVADARLLAEIQAMVQQALEEGMSAQDFVMYARRRLRMIKDAAGVPYNGADERESWSEEEREAYENDVSNIDSIARLKLILRTQSRLASGVREFQQQFEPFWVEMYPGMRFIRQPGAKEEYKRPLHVAHEGEVHLKTDIAFWLAMNDPAIGGFGNPYPPFGYNSWCWWEPVSRAECEALGLLKPGQKLIIPPALSAWGIGAAVQQLATASVRDLPAVQRARLEQSCEDAGIPLEQGSTEDELRVPTAEVKRAPRRTKPIAPPKARKPSDPPAVDLLDIGDGLFDDIFSARAAGAVPTRAADVLYAALAARHKPQRSSYATETAYSDALAAWRAAWGKGGDAA